MTRLAGDSQCCSMEPRALVHEAISRSVIGAFYEVYNTLGFGFLEHIYKLALERELRARGHLVQRERLVTVYYKNRQLGRQRIDLVVDNVLVVEVKSTVDLHAGARDQVYSYLRGTDLEIGLLLHFGPRPRFYRLRNASSSRARSESAVL